MSEQKKRPGIFKLFFGGVVIIVLLFILGTMVSTINDDNKVANESNAKKAVSAKKQTLNEKISDIVVEKLGKKSNNDKKRIVKISNEDLTNGKLIKLDLNANENLTTKMTKGGMLKDAANVIEPLTKLSNVDGIKLQWYYTMVDKYGNEKEEPVMKIQLDRETLNKINWKTFDYNNFEIVADSYWEHTALKK